MSRVRIVFVAMLATVAVGAFGVPAAAAANGTSVPPKVTSIPPLFTLHGIKGVAKNGKRFTGTYGIQRFMVTSVGGQRAVYAIGTLKGKLGGVPVTRYNVKMPAKLAGASGLATTAQATCPVLNLVLGPIDLNLLGLEVKLGGGTNANLPIVLNITAHQGGGLLGDLLCGLSNALSGPGILSTLNTELQQLSATLNSLISLLGGL
jgi:hypothetical protein